MKQLNIDLENCYGIKKLIYQFDFSENNACAIYAPNGAMKSSLAQTFIDVASDTPSRDRIFPARTNKRAITDEKGAALPKDNVFVIKPYDEVFGHSEKTSTLLVNATLRKEYEQLHIAIDTSKDNFLKAIKNQSNSKMDLEKEISSTFTKSDNQFYRALIRIKQEVLDQKDTPFSKVEYDTIFDEKVLSFLGTKDFKTAIEEYIKKYNELLAGSTYFKKGTFNYYNAATIAKNLADNGFFNAKHSLSLNADKKLEISTEQELEELISKEKEAISSDKDLKKKFAEIDKLINKNKDLRGFENYLANNEELLPYFENIEIFKEEVWKSYFKAHIELYLDLIEKYQSAEERKKQIEEQASKEGTQWEEVIEIFNSRFFVPFRLNAKNKVDVMLGVEPILSLGFTFQDGADKADVEKANLMQALSTGERKALYILNIIFEIEVRKKAAQETILIIDDIADSFDYKNKYAIIQYLKDIAEESYFYQSNLTHNFDFFRTINSRFIECKYCLMSTKNDIGIVLNPAAGIRNVFVKDWKPNYFTDPMKSIACIPFIRNLIEYTRGCADPEYIKLTSLLHWKSDSTGIRCADLDTIYNKLFATSGASSDGNKIVVDLIFVQANECLKAGRAQI